ncbi:uncharacterized protein TNCV_2907171 [Trichonephila clavipes]|nr:uncharacterized protein TNCV_2907171 [Trichonephila clavipes]
MQWLLGAIFQQDNAHPHMARVSQDCLCTVTNLARLTRSPNGAFLGSFGTASWASDEYDQTRGNVTANMERNVSRHRTKLVCLNAQSYRIVHSHQRETNANCSSKCNGEFDGTSPMLKTSDCRNKKMLQKKKKRL